MHLYTLFVFNEIVIIIIYCFRNIKCFLWVDFSCNVSLGLICIFIIFIIIIIIVIIIIVVIIIIAVVVELTQSKIILENIVEIEPQPVALDFKNLS